MSNKCSTCGRRRPGRPRGDSVTMGRVALPAELAAWVREQMAQRGLSWPALVREVLAAERDRRGAA